MTNEPETIELDLIKTARENAARYFELAKKFKRKAEGARKTMKRQAAKASATKKEKAGKKPAKKKWFQEFHWFFASDNRLCVAGKNAKQNELLVAKHLKDNDLFFHADVVGAAATILKDGAKAGEQALREAAQWAACYSRAWKQGALSCDVYAVRKDQVSKYSHGEFVGRGAFMIAGKRQWFKNTELKLALAVDEGELVCKPFVSGLKGVVLTPGRTPKQELAKNLAKTLGVKTDDLLAAVPGDSEASS